MPSFFRTMVVLICVFFSSFVYSDDEQSNQKITFGILSIAAPSRILENWTPFAEYLSTTLQRPIELVIPRGFKKMRQAVANGEIDFFYVNSFVFYTLKQQNHAIAVAQMQNIEEKVVSRSDFFVRRDSNIYNKADLKGKRIAYVSPMGAGGFLAPRAMLGEFGLNPKINTSEIFTKNLATSLHKVLLGEADAGTMCGVNFKLMTKKIESGELRIIASSDVYPENLIAAKSTIQPDLLARFRETVITMPMSQKGQSVLTEMYDMKIKRFIAYNEESEKITEQLMRQAHLD